MKLVAELRTPRCISSRKQLLPEGRRQGEYWPTQQASGLAEPVTPFLKGLGWEQLKMGRAEMMTEPVNKKMLPPSASLWAQLTWPGTAS